MTAREIAFRNMRDAFELWEEEYRADPEGFMDDAAIRSRNPGDLGELRATYFGDLLDRVRAKGART